MEQFKQRELNNKVKDMNDNMYAQMEMNVIQRKASQFVEKKSELQDKLVTSISNMGNSSIKSLQSGTPALRVKTAIIEENSEVSANRSQVEQD